MEGNQMKMREAVVQALRKLQELCVASCEDEDLRDDCERLIRSALSAPPRQCDVGTAEEQAVRFRDMCNKYYDDEYPCNNDCPLASLDIIHGFPRCQAYWAQTPYEAQEGAVE